MKLLCLLFLALLSPVYAIGQVEGPGTRVAQQFTKAGAELWGEARDAFFDSEGPAGAIEGAHYYAASTPIPIGSNLLLIVYVPDAMGKVGRRKYFFSLLSTKTGYKGPSSGMWCDNRDATFEVIGNDLIVVSCIDGGRPAKNILVNSSDRYYPAAYLLGAAGWKNLPNKYLVNSSFKFTNDDLVIFFTDKKWSRLKVDQLRKSSSITPDQADMLNMMIDQTPVRAGSRPSKTVTLTGKGTKFKSIVYDGPLNGILYYVDEPVRGRDSCIVNMDPVPYDGGNITGLTRTIYLDKGPKVSFTFLWHNGSGGGIPLTFDADNRSVKQPEPIVTLVADKFIKIVTTDAAGKEKARYAALIEHDLMFLSALPKEQMPYYRNHIFARYGYKFKNPAYQNFFDIMDWYKPQYDDAESVSKLMTADEREIVNQLAALEKNTK